MTQWKNIAGYEGYYQVSNQGTVRSLNRVIKGRFYQGKLLCLMFNKKTGYVQVSLRKEGVQKNFRVHRLVAEAFLPKVKGKNIVHHIDNCKTNNCSNNLRWSTVKENSRLAQEQGLYKPIHLQKFQQAIGSKHGRAKLNENNVVIIRYVLAKKLATQAKLAQLYNVSQSRISEINKGKIWGHVKPRKFPIAFYCQTFKELMMVSQ